ncbi:MAG: DNA-binding protein [Nitrosopumilus sp.]|nr:DNA-binding protein [Nitrosopumilus sp.]
MESTSDSKSQNDKTKYFSDSPHSNEERDVIFVGTKPIMTYVSATLTQLSTRPTVTIKARGKRITQAVDVSQMIVKRMDSVGYVISDVRISSDSLTSQDGKQRNVSTMEIDISKN